MLIEQIIEFESRVPGPLLVVYMAYFAKTGYFHDKTKIFKGKSSSALLIKMLQKAMYLDFGLDLK